MDYRLDFKQFIHLFTFCFIGKRNYHTMIFDQYINIQNSVCNNNKVFLILDNHVIFDSDEVGNFKIHNTD